MKVILLQDVKGTGKKGDIVEVNNGYAQNCLIPKKMAKFADNTVLNEKKQNSSSTAFHKQVELENAQTLGEKIKNLNVQMDIKIGDNGKAFGSITSKEISDKLSSLGFNIDKKKIAIKEGAIKQEGKYKVFVKLHQEVEVFFFLTVKGIK